VNYRLDPAALAEFQEAAQYYEASKAGLGEKFRVAVETAIRSILLNPMRWRMVDEDVHRAVVEIFPYHVLYTVEEHCILILAIAHVRRRPGYWKDRRKPD